MTADIALCRHSAKVCSVPAVACTWSASAAAKGPNWARCPVSRCHGSAPARSSSASLIISSDRTSRPCATGVCSHPLAAVRLIADSAETAFCAYTSAAALLGVGLNTWLGWWWADPAAALIIAGLAVKEGIECWEQESET